MKKKKETEKGKERKKKKRGKERGKKRKEEEIKHYILIIYIQRRFGLIIHK